MNRAEPQASTDPLGGNYPSPARAWFAVGVLTLIYIFSYIDRSIITLLVGPIRQDLQISDTQVSLLHGFAFALCYTLFGFPFGRLADSRRRIGLISIGILFWSLMTVLSGLARTFWQLFFARMGVGVGEATLSPAAYSIIADYFPPEKLSRALSVYVLGTYLGMALAYVIGGAVVGALSAMPPVHVPFLGPLVGWRIAFLIVGLPGIVLTALIWTVREPRRRGTLRNADATPRSVSPGEVVAYLRQHRGTYSALFVGFGMLSLLINGMTLWTPTFLIRVHGWTIGEAGVAYGLMIGIFGGSGVIAGGYVSDRLQKRGESGACFVAGAVGAACAVVPTALMPLMPTNTLVLLLMAPSLFFASMPFALAVSAIQQITPNQMRGQVSAIYLFFATLLGIACGPLFVALLTDHVFQNDAAVGYSMAIVGGLVALIAAVMLLGSIRLYKASLASAEEWKRASA